MGAGDASERIIADSHLGVISKWIGDGRAADLRMLGIEQQACNPAEREPHAVVGGPAAIRPRGAKAGNRTMNEPRVHCGKPAGAQPEPLHYAHPVVLDQNIAARQELLKNLAARGISQVKLHAALAAVIGDEMRTVLAAAEASEWIAALRVLDLDDVR